MKAFLLVFVLFFSKPSQALEGVELKYLIQMVQQLQEGILFAELAEKKSKLPEIQTAAKRISKENKNLVSEITRWILPDIYYGSPEPGDIADISELSELQKASTKDFDEKFLTSMKNHYLEAIYMTNEYLPLLRDEGLKDLAEKAVEMSSEEKKELNQLSKILGSDDP